MSTCLNANHFWLCRQKFYLVVGIFLAQPAVGLRSNVLFYNSNSNHVTNLLLLERSSNEIIKKIVRIFRIVDRIPHPHTFFDFCFTSVPKAIVEIEFVGHQASDVDLRQITKIDRDKTWKDYWLLWQPALSKVFTRSVQNLDIFKKVFNSK